jgi:hypothetical protein
MDSPQSHRRHYNDKTHQVAECLNPDLIAEHQEVADHIISTSLGHSEKGAWDHGVLVCSSQDSFYGKIDSRYLVHETLKVIYKDSDLVIEGTIKGHPPKPFKKRYSLPEAISVEDISWKMNDGFLEIRAKASSSNAGDKRATYRDAVSEHVSDAYAGGFKNVRR